MLKAPTTAYELRTKNKIKTLCAIGLLKHTHSHTHTTKERKKHTKTQRVVKYYEQSICD